MRYDRDHDPIPDQIQETRLSSKILITSEVVPVYISS